MRKILGYLAFVLILVSCGFGNKKFRLEGRLRNLNQGEFYVYSPDGGMTGTDTIKVRDGRFSYEKAVQGNYTFIVIFPNYSELAVFAAPSVSLNIKGDATHLKEITVKGSDINEQFTGLRSQLNRLTPPEERKEVADFIRKHPQSPISNYLLNRYFVLTVDADLKQAAELAALMVKAQPDNARLLFLRRQLDVLKKSQLEAKIPPFSATDLKGHKVSNAQLDGKVNVVNVWATWSYQSGNILHRLHKLRKTYGSKLAVVTLCLDGDVKEVRRRVDRDSIPWPVVCDGQMFQSPMATQLGIATVPSILVADKSGRIVARDMEPDKVEQELEKRLK